MCERKTEDRDSMGAEREMDRWSVCVRERMNKTKGEHCVSELDI